VSRGVSGDEFLLESGGIGVAGTHQFEVVSELFDGSEVILRDPAATGDADSNPPPLHGLYLMFNQLKVPSRPDE
jgi:hypothetical protein